MPSDDYNLENVLTLGVLTGSRAFNCPTKDSDWDIVITYSDLPNYHFAVDYTCTDFLSDKDMTGYVPHGHNKPGYDLSEHPDLGEDFVEYDNSTIWGPLEQIIKYWDDNDNCINLFVYNDNHAGILEKFKELNNLMNFLHGSKLKDKDYRIKAFIDIINKVGITNYS